MVGKEIHPFAGETTDIDSSIIAYLPLKNQIGQERRSTV
jgi:hypothetical protein